MQTINRIQNAMINNNASIQGAMVVSANAHRAYQSFKPCDTKPVSKCPGTSSRSYQEVVPLVRQPNLVTGERGRHTTGPVGGMRWQLSHQLMPATLWATFVLNHQLCG